MKKRRLFISSVQKEFEGERLALRDYLHANPLLAEPLYLTKYIERMGTGTGDMIRRCREAGLREPEFRVTDGFVTIMYRPKQEGSGEGAVTTPAMESSGLGERLGERLGATRAAIIQAMQDNPKVTAKRLAEILGISTTAVEKNIQHLKTQGYVKRHGPAKGGHWEIVQ